MPTEDEDVPLIENPPERTSIESRLTKAEREALEWLRARLPEKK